MSFLSLSFLWLRLRLAIPFVWLSFHASLTRYQSLGLSQTTALGSVSRGAGHTRWLPCSRSSTGPRSGCWKPSGYASAAPSDGHLLCRCPPVGTGRYPVYRMCLYREQGRDARQRRYTEIQHWLEFFPSNSEIQGQLCSTVTCLFLQAVWNLSSTD